MLKKINDIQEQVSEIQEIVNEMRKDNKQQLNELNKAIELLESDIDE